MLNSEYEKRLKKFIADHPFLSSDNVFRNPVFEAFALSTIMTSYDKKYQNIVDEFYANHKFSHHLLHMFKSTSKDKYIYKGYIKYLIKASQEFHSKTLEPFICMIGDQWEEYEFSPEDFSQEVKITIEMTSNTDETKQIPCYDFYTEVSPDDELNIGNTLSNTNIDIPCSITLQNAKEIEFTTPVNISAKKISFLSEQLSIKSPPEKVGRDTETYIRCKNIHSTLIDLTTERSSLEIQCNMCSCLSYPLIAHATKVEPEPVDKDLQNKIFRIYRILREFRSHSKGSLAKFVDKINHNRVLKNDTGKKILSKLISDGVIYKDSIMYHIDSDKLDKHLGVSWHDIKSGIATDQLKEYLSSISN